MPTLFGQILRVLDAVLNGPLLTKDTVGSQDALCEIVPDRFADFHSHRGWQATFSVLYFHFLAAMEAVDAYRRRRTLLNFICLNRPLKREAEENGCIRPIDGRARS